MNENFLNGLKMTREIEEEISKMHDSIEVRSLLSDDFTSSLYSESLQQLETFNTNILSMINNMNGIINEMKKKIDTKEESRGIWEMYPNFFKGFISNRKIQNLESKSRTLLSDLKKLFRQKKEVLNEAKQKYELLGGVIYKSIIYSPIETIFRSL